MKKLAALAISIALALGMADNARAHVTVRWAETSTDCWKYSITKTRDGVLTHSPLWKLQQQVHWCTDDPPVSNVWYGPSVLRSHYENNTWNWNGYEKRWRKTLTNPVRWQFFVQAEFTGNGAYLITPHDHPWIRMTIWKRNPTHVSYTANCGC